MSSVSKTSPDALVTVKVTYEGNTRRAKMPLRDMVPQTLESNIRTLLHIPADTKAIIERYSDSAGAHVLLDTQNVAVYKQLYRAAKAKSKLKIRVTLLQMPQRMAPKPASVEDEPETASLSPTEINPEEEVKPAEEQKPAPAQEPAVPSETTLPLRGLPISKMYNSAVLNDAAKYISDRKDMRMEFENRLSNLMERNAGLATNLAKHQEHRRDLYAQKAELNAPTATATISDLLNGPAFAKLPISPPATRHVNAAIASFAVCCNSCEQTIPDGHYHCSTCDDGDFDLCISCVDQGIACYSASHWLIKRTMVNGQIVTSTTETIPPKSKSSVVTEKAKEAEPTPQKALSTPPAEVPAVQNVPFDPLGTRWTCLGNMRTCNSCVQELPDRQFLHCDTCEDYDLCQMCFSKDAHGHHPKHGFAPAVPGTQMPAHIRMKLPPGRNQMHHAICDGCDKYITGVRHKCLDCPDWDYCGECVKTAGFVHAKHRFAPVYEALGDAQAHAVAAPVHMGICCDGPLCSLAPGYPSYIRGVRYKCAVCHDLDMCANCEACPANEHNKTHPLIKFNTPVRHVSVTTTGEHQDGKRMPAMGDRSSTDSKATETVNSTTGNSMNIVQTVVDVKPVEPSFPKELVKEAKPEPEIKQDKKEIGTPTTPVLKEEDLRAVFLRDSVSDGTILPPNHVFEQTWVLRNEGNTSWPAGCSVKFVGGDYMGHVDSAHPAGISELVSASESTVCYAPLAPGQHHSFTVLLRTPPRAGKIVSYWRLTTQEGLKFGHRLWCEVNVRPAVSETKPAPRTPVEEPKEEEPIKATSTMIFPKLEKESPSSSMHEEVKTESGPQEQTPEESEGFEECAEEEDWDASDDGFMTDEEYDILDASDEEFLEEQQKKLLKK